MNNLELFRSYNRWGKGFDWLAVKIQNYEL